MATPWEGLITRLGEKGLAPEQIPGFIRDVLGIIGDGGVFTTSLVNEKIAQLGWGSGIFDESSFQLIVQILESEWGYRIRHYNVG
ncbi:MAG: hypothetical protein ACLFVT_08210 [Syntrophobacteria bacterium]